MIYITGDCHADFSRLSTDNFPEQKEMTKDDYVIICGDFGGVWNKDTENPREKWDMEWLDSKPFTTLFVDGNHENFDRLYAYPVEEWHGGKVHKIRDSVIHLMRGQIFEIDGRSFFTFGGASSHDIQGGEFLNRMHLILRHKKRNWTWDGSPTASIMSAGGIENFHRKQKWLKVLRILKSVVMKWILLLHIAVQHQHRRYTVAACLSRIY